MYHCRLLGGTALAPAAAAWVPRNPEPFGVLTIRVSGAIAVALAERHSYVLLWVSAQEEEHALLSPPRFQQSL